MRLGELLDSAGIEIRCTSEEKDGILNGLTDDSREVKKGYIFIAVRGLQVDGHDYVARAVDKGATAVIVEIGRHINVPKGCVLIEVDDTQKTLGKIAHAFQGHPTARMSVFGVTGTNGKTSIAFLMESIFRAAGYSPGLIGTVEYRYEDRCETSSQTTPTQIKLASLMKNMADAGVDALSMEVSSHAIDQQRIEGIKFDVGLFTNLTQDHLDYHRDMDVYREVKKRFFTQYLLPLNAIAVFNIDNEVGRSFAIDYTGPKMTYGIRANADVKALHFESDMRGTRIELNVGAEDITVHSRLIGKFNVSNITGAVAAAHAFGISPEQIRKGITDLECVPGRFEQVTAGQLFRVLVDYAHTPDALKNVLDDARELASGKLITVFGCGGDRDKGKRPLMGKIVAERSDRFFITSDNPRSEQPLAIIEMIEEGITAESADYEVIPDRRKAIETALNDAREGDVVVIAGKGHENYQLIGEKRLFFDDRKVVREALGRLKDRW